MEKKYIITEALLHDTLRVLQELPIKVAGSLFNIWRNSGHCVEMAENITPARPIQNKKKFRPCGDFTKNGVKNGIHETTDSEPGVP